MATGPRLGPLNELPGITRLVANWPVAEKASWRTLFAPVILRLPPSRLRHLELFADSYQPHTLSASVFHGLSSLTSLKLTIAGYVLLTRAFYAELGEGLRHLVQLSELELEFHAPSLDGLCIFLRAASATSAGQRIHRIVLTGRENKCYALAEDCLRGFPAAQTEFRTIE